jgi:hypothetical protein
MSRNIIFVLMCHSHKLLDQTVRILVTIQLYYHTSIKQFFTLLRVTNIHFSFKHGLNFSSYITHLCLCSVPLIWHM